ncbi:cysteine desulfurase, sulfur acceptor subunit CsdE [Enterovibrio norvegicus]|uniref:cysteine desulfurase sulfur acceptor subunit CsdE n=1 Tax=Enterovibrio norvegicus TaxID=188144 RepID=UPI0002D5CFDF|nr:cysteine desulfurase sulfur acceptor subunit CsdE [Enterovibrio norvegicus]OEE62543.1 cysteine desulfurase, sulfur acceptor subunit CsdE [Enterovibrio norvegicus]
MNNFPKHPFGTEITNTSILRDMAKCRSWEDKYRLVIQLGRKLPSLDQSLKAQSVDIPGCESEVWLIWQEIDGVYHFSADSDARIVKGLISLILAEIEGKTREDLRKIDFDAYFEAMDLLNHLSQSRSNGIRSIIEQIKKI